MRRESSLCRSKAVLRCTVSDSPVRSSLINPAINVLPSWSSSSTKSWLHTMPRAILQPNCTDKNSHGYCDCDQKQDSGVSTLESQCSRQSIACNTTIRFPRELNLSKYCPDTYLLSRAAARQRCCSTYFAASMVFALLLSLMISESKTILRPFESKH